MEGQKLDNMLNLALDVSEKEREQSLELNVGYNPIMREWDLIVKYSGTLECVRNLGGKITELQNGFAIVSIAEERINQLANCVEVEFIEKPKRLFFQIKNAKIASCISPVQNNPLGLTGKGVLVGIVDSGIDFRNSVFRYEDGTTRIAFLWDQTAFGEPPEGYLVGVEYNSDEINDALRGYASISSIDVSGHGTAVAGILAGNSAEYKGVAYESELVVVKMGVPQENGFPRTIELMQGIDYIVKKAVELRKPVAINVSFGNTYGAHDGSSLLERFISDIASQWKSVICIGAGNEGNTAGHVSGILDEAEDTVIELAVQENSPALNVQLWKIYADQVDVALRSPSGIWVGPVQERIGTQMFVVGNTRILLYYGKPSPFSVDQEIFFEFLAEGEFVDAGIWKIVLTPRKIVNGEFALWLPSENVLNEGTGFLFPTKESTLTIPATAYQTIGVGAYDQRRNAYADFSGRGPAGPGRRAKPDLAAPGVDILSPAPGGSLMEVSGTSFAVPFVTGSAALLMEWGIIKGNDPFLYGEKIKAYLQRGAKPFQGIEEYPNSLVGYGALCLENSFP